MKLTFPYILKTNKIQKEIIEDIMWHCEKVYNTLNYNIYQGTELISLKESLNMQGSKIYKNIETQIGILNIYIHIHYKKLF